MTPDSIPFVSHRPRRVERVVAGQATQDGAGVKLTRVLTQTLQRRLDPFLIDRKSTRLNSSHVSESRMPSSA